MQLPRCFVSSLDLFLFVFIVFILENNKHYDDNAAVKHNQWIGQHVFIYLL